MDTAPSPRWSTAGVNPAALALVVMAFAVRAWQAAAGYLTPDEALHYVIAQQPSASAVYGASLPEAHPPLYFLLLHYWIYWTPLGNSEFVLRLPCVLAGAALPWVVSRWVDDLFGSRAGMLALAFTASSPSLIMLSAEIRGYALLLLCMAGGLLSLERSFKTGSALAMVLYTLLLYAAILTHFGTIVFAVAIGLYAAVRIWKKELPRQVVLLWCAGHVGAALLYAGLYVTHISKLRGGTMEHEAMRGWLLREYFHPGERSVFNFVFRQTGDAFQYIFGENQVGIVMLLVFVGGVWALLRRQEPVGDRSGRSKTVGLLMLLPFVVNCLTGLAQLYPYGGTRHSGFLALFAIAGVSFVFAQWLAVRQWAKLLGVAVLLIIPFAKEVRHILRPEWWDRAVIQSAIGYIRQTIPAGGLILTDRETARTLNYYLDRGLPPREALEHYGGYRVVMRPLNGFSVETFRPEFEQFIRETGLRVGERVWVVSTPWEPPTLYDELSRHPPQPTLGNPRIFGGNISIFQVTVGA